MGQVVTIKHLSSTINLKLLRDRFVLLGKIKPQFCAWVKSQGVEG
jgi:hypothetical protein